MKRIPTTIVTGFLGAGKTSLIRHLLETANGHRIALIINEFGDLGIDREIVTGCGIDACRDDDVVGPQAPDQAKHLAAGGDSPGRRQILGAGSGLPHLDSRNRTARAFRHADDPRQLAGGQSLFGHGPHHASRHGRRCLATTHDHDPASISDVKWRDQGVAIDLDAARDQAEPTADNRFRVDRRDCCRTHRQRITSQSACLHESLVADRGKVLGVEAGEIDPAPALLLEQFDPHLQPLEPPRQQGRGFCC